MKYTGIWQARDPLELDWIQEVFSDVVLTHVWDCKHELVLDDSILFDAYLEKVDPAYYRKFRGKNAFLVHFFDENYEGGYDEIYRNFRGVFRGFWSEVFNPSYIFKLPLGYCAGFGKDSGPSKSASERKYLWSFVGDGSKSTRPAMVRALAFTQPNLIVSTRAVPGAERAAGI